MNYLDNAATTYPKPPEVLKAMQSAMRDIGANPGRSGHKLSLNAGRAIHEARTRVSELLGIEDPMRLIFCFNCTDALNLAIKGCLHKGDHVITSELEHNSVLRPLRGLEKRGIISLTILKNDGSTPLHPSEIESAIQRNTRLCAITQASNVTGAIQPINSIGKICRKRGVLFLVDGAQGAGILPVSLSEMPVDMYAFAGHKGPLGPHGTGGLYIRKGLHIFALREGGTGSSSDSQLQPSEMPDAYESGTANLPGLCGLREGVKFVMRHAEEISGHEQALRSRLVSGLKNIQGVKVYGPSPQTSSQSQTVGVVSFNIRAIQSGTIAETLDAAGIAVRAGLHCAPALHESMGTLTQGAVRASIGFFNTWHDIDSLLMEVNTIAKGR